MQDNVQVAATHPPLNFFICYFRFLFEVDYAPPVYFLIQHILSILNSFIIVAKIYKIYNEWGSYAY